MFEAVPTGLNQLMQTRELSYLLPPLRLMAVRALGDHEAAENVAQEALVRGILALGGGRMADNAQVPGKIAVIVHGILRDSVKTDAAHPEALARAISSDDVDDLRQRLRGLAESDRKVLLLSYVDGLSSEEIAKTLRESVSFVHERRAYVLERLRGTLANSFVRDEGGAVLQFFGKQNAETEECRGYERDGTIARYVAGTSSEKETPAFEIHYLECRQCFEDVIVGAAVRMAFT